MKSTIVKATAKPTQIKFDDMVVGTLYRFTAKDEPDETGVVLCAKTDAGPRLVELVGEDVGFVWGDEFIDENYVFTVFTDAVTVSNE